MELQESKARGGLRQSYHAFLVAALALVLGCDAAAESYCEVFAYNGNKTVLSVPKEHYAFPRSPDSMISLKLRYRDLGAPRTLSESYDPAELENPAWSLSHSNEIALMRIHRETLRWPRSLSDLYQRYGDGKEIESDWDGWNKFKPCFTTCTTAIYMSKHWQSLGVVQVECFEMSNRRPIWQGCIAYDRVDGLLIEYGFPSVKKERFAEFRERIVTFLRARIVEGKTSCKAKAE